jgi:hypothetical protein
VTKPKRTPREEIERAFHVSFKLPEQARVLLDNYRDQVAAQRGKDIAFRIRAELVCCTIYDRVQAGELAYEQARNSPAWHDLCYWGEASAQLAEGQCPGYDTTPNVCQCTCEGCARNCDDHQEEPR